MFVAGLGPEQQPASSSSNDTTPAGDTSAFSTLIQSLRHVLTAKRGFAIYDAGAGKGHGTDFHVVLVDKV